MRENSFFDCNVQGSLGAAQPIFVKLKWGIVLLFIRHYTPRNLAIYVKGLIDLFKCNFLRFLVSDFELFRYSSCDGLNFKYMPQIKPEDNLWRYKYLFQGTIAITILEELNQLSVTFG